jgi:hypothetical protein
VSFADDEVLSGDVLALTIGAGRSEAGVTFTDPELPRTGCLGHGDVGDESGSG